MPRPRRTLSLIPATPFEQIIGLLRHADEKLGREHVQGLESAANTRKGMLEMSENPRRELIHEESTVRSEYLTRVFQNDPSELIIKGTEGNTRDDIVRLLKPLLGKNQLNIRRRAMKNVESGVHKMITEIGHEISIGLR
jgi:hypothetical protein